MDRRGSKQGYGRLVVLLLLAGALQFAAEYAGLSWQGVQAGVAAPVWIGTAIAVVVVFFGGYRYLWAVAAGAVLASIAAHGETPILTHIASGAASACEAGVGVALLRRFDFHPSFDRLRDVAVLALGVAGVATATSATLGVGSLLITDAIEEQEFWRTWITWWFGDATSAVVLAPLLILVIWSLRWRLSTMVVVRSWPFALSAGGLGIVSCLVFLLPGGSQLFALPFVVFPFVLFMAVRFWPIGAIASNVMVTAIALAGTYGSVGPFGTHAAIIGEGLGQALLETQVFAVAVAVSTLALAAAIAEREEAREQARDAERRYRSLVEHVPAGIYLDAIEDPETGRITTMYISPQIEEILGYKAAGFYEDAELWTRIRHPDDRDAAFAANLRHYRFGELLSLETRIITADGRERWLREEAVVLTGIAGRERVSQGIVVDITDLMRSQRERDLLRVRMVNAQEEERARIAADIHDDSVQQMTAVGLRLEVLRRQVAAGSVDDEAFEKLVEAVGKTIARLRHLMFELRPPSLDTQGLAAAIEGYVSGEAQSAGLEFEVQNRLATEPDASVRAGLYRMAQEALRNVVRHAGARRVVVSVEGIDGGVSLRIVDDGTGMPADSAASADHFGLAGIRERATMLGGTARITSGPGEGTTVDVWVPS